MKQNTMRLVFARHGKLMGQAYGPLWNAGSRREAFSLADDYDAAEPGRLLRNAGVLATDVHRGLVLTGEKLGIATVYRALLRMRPDYVLPFATAIEAIADDEEPQKRARWLRAARDLKVIHGAAVWRDILARETQPARPVKRSTTPYLYPMDPASAEHGAVFRAFRAGALSKSQLNPVK